MKFNPDDIMMLAGTIWESVLSLPIETDEPGSVGNHPRSMAACIQISGAWNGAILLDCPVEFARLAASVMFSTEPANAALPDLQDAIAELVNMIGGNIKGLLPETCFLSLPAVVEGGDYSARVPGSTPVGRVAFVCQGHRVSIVILEKTREETAAA
ncbi:MAG: chemotaxis protein CheX [Planctomycetota bacterium]|nr:chemotaxis protein CheX [Planctomycetota bacterium]